MARPTTNEVVANAIQANNEVLMNQIAAMLSAQVSPTVAPVTPTQEIDNVTANRKKQAAQVSAAQPNRPVRAKYVSQDFTVLGEDGSGVNVSGNVTSSQIVVSPAFTTEKGEVAITRNTFKGARKFTTDEARQLVKALSAAIALVEKGE